MIFHSSYLLTYRRRPHQALAALGQSLAASASVQPLVSFSGDTVNSPHVVLVLPQLLRSCWRAAMNATTVPSELPAVLSTLNGEHVRNPPPTLHFSRFVKLRGITTERKTFTMNSSLSARNEGVVKDELTLRDKDAVIIVDHGSRRQESNLLLNEFVAMFRGRTGHGIVEPAHMEIAKPSIVDAFKLCVQQGANRVIISPFFLSPGRHWNQDIPALAAEAAREHPGISYIVTAPLGLHELLVDVMMDRIKHCLSHVAGDADECDVCAGTGKCCLR